MATAVAPYLHVLDGRLRIKILQVKGAPERAGAVAQLLRGLTGVTEVTANPRTGNVLVLFTSTMISQHDIITALQQVGYLRTSHSSAAQERQSFTSIIVQSAVELAIERLVLALI